MDDLEFTRQKLHKVIDSGNVNEILKISQELDKLILCFMETEKTNERKTA